MKRISSIDRAIHDVTSFSARYELFVKMLRNEQKSSKTLINYSHHLALLCLQFGRLPEDIAGEEYIGYYILIGAECFRLSHEACSILCPQVLVTVSSISLCF